MGKVVEKILEALQERAEITADLIDLVLAGKAGYYRQARQSFMYGPKSFKHDWAELYRNRQKFYSLLNKLKREGLVSKKKVESKTIWHITRGGLKKLKTFNHVERRPGGIIMREYVKKKAPAIVIVSYDIPEKERKKRYWLQENLISLEFSPLHKSVWIGTTAVPTEFIKDLRRQNILRCVHIFSVDRSGTIERAS